MPKKTRRQKILAERRRHFASTLPSIAPTPHVPEATVPSPTFHFDVSHAPAKAINAAADPEELSVIHKDLAKTLILALIAVGIELVMSRVLHGT